MNKEILKGSVDILLLTVIAAKDTYGYEIIKTIQQKSESRYNMKEGTLYPALKRLEFKELIISYWGESEGGGRRKYYKITLEGEEKLKESIQEWKVVNNLIHACLEG